MNKKIAFYLIALGSFVCSYDTFVNKRISVGMYETVIANESTAVLIAFVYLVIGLFCIIIASKTSNTDILE